MYSNSIKTDRGGKTPQTVQTSRNGSDLKLVSISVRPRMAISLNSSTSVPASWFSSASVSTMSPSPIGNLCLMTSSCIITTSWSSVLMTPSNPSSPSWVSLCQVMRLIETGLRKKKRECSLRLDLLTVSQRSSFPIPHLYLLVVTLFLRSAAGRLLPTGRKNVFRKSIRKSLSVF